MDAGRLRQWRRRNRQQLKYHKEEFLPPNFVLQGEPMRHVGGIVQPLRVGPRSLSACCTATGALNGIFSLVLYTICFVVEVTIL